MGHDFDGTAPWPQKDFLDEVASRLAVPNPLAFLQFVSGLVAIMDPRDPGADLLPGQTELADAGPFVEALIESPSRESTALLAVLSELLPGNHLAQRAGREVRSRADDLPEWIELLDRAEAGPASELVDPTGVGENVNVSVELAGDWVLTGVVYIDHGLGTVVKDGFVIPLSPEQLRAQYARTGDIGPSAIVDIDPAEAKARVEQAIAEGVLSAGLETDTWPAARPLVEWMIGKLPSGGLGFAQPEDPTGRDAGSVAEEIDVDTAFADLLDSPASVNLPTAADRELAHFLMGYLVDKRGGDPLLWTPADVGQVMTDWLIRATAPGARYMLALPRILIVLVEYGSRRRGLPEGLTMATLAAIEAHTPQYYDALSADVSLSLANDIAAARESTPGPAWFAAERHQRMTLIAEYLTGSAAAYAELTDEPLPDEPFDWTGIPTDIRDRVATILAMVEEVVDDFFDVEIRTACRRVLARTAVVEPAVFRRRSRDDTAAAAIVWAVTRLNGAIGSRHQLTAQELMGAFGVSGTVSDRARPFLRSFGAEDWQPANNLTFGTPDVLVARMRQLLIGWRDGGPAGGAPTPG